jgi:Raf kinase inhibitor-like YbhB/YbcL family protein
MIARGGVAAATVAILCLVACGDDSPHGLVANSTPLAPESIELRSSAFADGAAMPVDFTCDGRDVSPPLAWSGGPSAAEYAIVVIDIDAPGGGFSHWVVFGIPGSASSLDEGVLPSGAREGGNDFGSTGYRGPCPPSGSGAHRYVFTLSAVGPPGTETLPDGSSAEDVVGRVACCTLAFGRLTGAYER